MKKYLLSFLVFSFFGLIAKAQEAPKTANEIVSNAVAKAKQENKKVLIMFHASWCGWCKKMDASLENASCKKYFDNNFVIDHIDIAERGDKVSLENTGGEQLYEQYGGKQGIPFWVIIDADGNVLANSNYKSPSDTTNSEPQNVGCPGSEEEVGYFISLLKKYTNISDADTKAVHDCFRKNDPNNHASAML